MDKLKLIKIIKAYFLHCFNEEVEVIYDVNEATFKIGNSEFDLEDDKFMYIIFPIKDKFLRWAWDTNLQIDILDEEFVFNDFYLCLQTIMKFHLRINLQDVDNMRLFGMFEDDYDDNNPFS